MKPAIRVENLSKQYRLGAVRGSYQTLRESLVEGARKVLSTFARNGDDHGRDANTFWALKDVSFEVEPGEVIGLIGRNGAGKSTLLKVLSRITEPTNGRAEIRGRVGSLLEVGTGFHPELTGRENIYLNGGILGMSRKEIDHKFDEIVGFAEMGEFLDTPVKRYSSGMYVRLAFAVAAHLNPEILIVDEVLAVGDVTFQKKCLNKMSDVSRQGRTVLFVSHNMGAVQRLCSRAIHLHSGKVMADGPKQEVIANYLTSDNTLAPVNKWIDLTALSRRGTGQVRFTGLRYKGFNQAIAYQPHPDGAVEFSLAIESDVPRTVGTLAVTFYDRFGTKLVNADTISEGKTVELKAGQNEVSMRIHKLHLNPGTYILGLCLANFPLVFDWIESALTVEIVDFQTNSLGRRPLADGLVTCSFDVEEARG